MPGMFLGRGTQVPSTIKGTNGLAIKPEPGKALAPLMQVGLNEGPKRVGL